METMNMLPIGTVIDFKTAYSRKASIRIKFDEHNWKLQIGLNPIHPEKTKGIIIGWRHVIMSDAKFDFGGVGDDAIQSTLTGKREWVYLVSENPRLNPFIVRISDII